MNMLNNILGEGMLGHSFAHVALYFILGGILLSILYIIMNYKHSY